MKHPFVFQMVLIFWFLISCNNTFAQAGRSPIVLEKPSAEDIYYRGTSAYFLKKYEVAIFYFDRVIKMDNDFYSKGYNKRGQCNFQLKNYEEALLDYDEAIENTPRFAEAFNNRGRLFFYGFKKRS